MQASPEHGRLAEEGQAKFRDKGQFRKERRVGEETEWAAARKEGEKLKNVIFHLLGRAEISQDISN